jgi:hypothetical protein
MRTVIAHEFAEGCPSCGSGQVMLIPPEAPSYRHKDGNTEAHLGRIRAVKVHRPSELDGNLCVRLAVADGAIDLAVSADVAETLGVALIKTTAMYVDDLMEPSDN